MMKLSFCIEYAESITNISPSHDSYAGRAREDDRSDEMAALMAGNDDLSSLLNMKDHGHMMS